MAERTSLEYAHKDKHPEKIDIVVNGEVLDNAMEAKKDEWFAVEAMIADHREKTFFRIVHTVECRDVKIFERK